MSCHVWVPTETGDGQASHKDQYGEASGEQTYDEDFITTHMYGPADFLQQPCDGNFLGAQDPPSVLQTSGDDVPGTNLKACKSCLTGSHTSLYQPQSPVLCGRFPIPCEAQAADCTGSPHEAYCVRDTEDTAYDSPNGAKSQHCVQPGAATRAQRTLRSSGERPSTQSAASQLPCGHTGSTATPELHVCCEPEGPGCEAFQSTMAGGKPIEGMMPRVTSLNVSVFGEEAFDQLLGPELSGDSPQQLTTPSSFLTNGPTVNPALSGYSPRSMPIQLSIAPDANPAGSSDYGIPTFSLQQPSMVTYSEPLPVLPGHHMPQPTRSPSGQQGLPPSDLISVLSAPEHQQDQLTQPATEGQIQAWSEPRQKESQHVCNSAPDSGPLPLDRSTPTYAEQPLPLPAHSASPPSATSAEQHEDCPIPSSDVASPGRCIGSRSGFSKSSLPMSSTLAASALQPSQVHMGGSSDGLIAAPLRQGQMKSREEVLQQGHSSQDTGAPMASQAPPITVPPVVASGQTVFATACVQPKSPIVQLHSAGGSVAESSTMYSNSGACPYPYSMPETYSMPYSMPYGDPYYSYSYPYHPSMDGPPPPHDPDTLITYGAPHMGHQCLDSSTSRMLHYPGFMAPRQRLYRRFISGAHGRRTCQPANGMSHDGLMSMSSDPTNCASTSAAQLTGERPAPLAAACGTRKCGAVTTLDYMSQELGSGATGCAEPDGTSHTYRSHMVPAPRPHSNMEAEMDGVRAARACHEQFSADDVPLPLPPSTVDGIRHELRVVTQELLQRRMGEARRQQPATGGSEQPRLQLTRSGASGDQAASLRQDHEPLANAVSQEAQTAPAAHADPYFQAGTAPGGHSFNMLPHKRGAASDPSSSAGPSPVRSRPAPSAPVGHVGRSADHRGADLPGEVSNDPASQPLSSLPIPTTAVPCGSHHLTPSVSGPVMSRSALVGTCKHPAPAINMSVPAGPRPAMSGKSAASGTHGASVAQMPPACGRQQPQPQISAALLMGAHCVGHQGSMVAEAEDDGEEVHGPLQRCSNTRSRGVVSCGTRAACGPLPFPPGYYGTSVPLPSYDYSHGYYYPPPMTANGMRMYGMTPSVASSAPPSYRLSSASAPTYGLPPPPPGMSTAPMPGPAAWSDYFESQGGLPLAPGPAGAVPSGLVHGPAPTCS